MLPQLSLAKQCEQSENTEKSPYSSEGFLSHMGGLKHVPPPPQLQSTHLCKEFSREFPQLEPAQ